MLRIGQHFSDFELPGFRQPAVEDFEKKITLKVDEDRLRILVAAFHSAAPEGLFAGTNVNIPRPALRRPQSFDGHDEVSRDPRIISRRQLLQAHCPRAALHNDLPAAQPRHMRSAAEQKRMDPERDYPGAGEGTEIFARAPR